MKVKSGVYFITIFIVSYIVFILDWILISKSNESLIIQNILFFLILIIYSVAFVRKKQILSKYSKETITAVLFIPNVVYVIYSAGPGVGQNDVTPLFKILYIALGVTSICYMLYYYGFIYKKKDSE
ncbi:hypothetical protein BN85400880 [Alteracholeplasma palmae J233]|uniref:Uncharacterized protein n=1 Tax=Alteracholeplasma palmae (strain ATCC 49389 / J233) TaxID=1318466 RepID=U4KNB2_ALTPJ|nr:hypothetical protein [Alteracholeplasma palmae]CCV63665.1 hypothetical protein BN85400880 [Alteracholeplasma palmae J233]